MATITSAGTGNWGDTGTWVGGVVPVEGDKVIIAATHVVTVDGTFTAGDDTVVTTMGSSAINVYGTLKASRTVNSSLTCKGCILLGLENATLLDYGTEADPLPANIKAEIVINKATTPAFRAGLFHSQGSTSKGGSVYMRSANQRVSNVKLSVTASAGASTVDLVSGSHNWEISDKVMLFKTTSGNNTDENETRTITGISGNQITLNSALTYSHLAGSPVANFTRNIVVRSYNEVSGQTGLVQFGCAHSAGPATSFYYHFYGVEFRNIGRENNAEAIIYYSGRTPYTPGIQDVVYTKCSMTGLGNVHLISNMVPFMRFYDCVASYGQTLTWEYTTKDVFFIDGGCYTGRSISAGGTAFHEIKNVWFTAIGAANQFAANAVVNNLTLSGCGISLIYNSTSNVYVEDSDLGYTYGWNLYYGQGGAIDATKYSKDSIKLVNCLLNSLFAVPDTGTDIYNLSPYTKVEYVAKNRDITLNETWSGSGKWHRDNSIFNRSASSLGCFTYSTNALTRELKIPCGNTKSIRVVGYIRRDTAATSATVTISGLGITPVTYSASAAIDTWEQYDLTATNNVAGYDGNLTLTYTANASVSTSTNVYFDGVPDIPFITKCRHYGFAFDEASPTRTVNPVLTVSEAVAIAYTGVTITGTQITVAAGTADTWAKVYAYSQAYYCDNLASDVLLTSTDGNNFAMPLATKLSWPAMGADGTLVGGWLLLVAGTHSYKLSGTKIDCTTAGAYDMAGTVFSGTVELVNSSGGAVSIALPAGTSHTNTGPSITVTVPSLTTTLAANVSLAGAEVRIYDMDNSPAGSLGTELAGTESCPGATFGFVTTASNTVWVQIMLAGYKEFGQSLVTPAASTTYTFTLRGEVNA